MSNLRIYNPVAVAVKTKLEPAKRAVDLRGKRIGLYWNMKAGGDVALVRCEELLSKRFPGATFKHYRGSVGWLMRQASHGAANHAMSKGAAKAR